LVLQRIQEITRTSPYKLRKDEALHKEFIKLLQSNFKFVGSFKDPSIKSNFLRLYHRKKSVSEALTDYVEEIKEKLKLDNVPYIECTSIDMKKVSDSRTDLRATDDISVVNMLNNKVREPRQLLFWPGALFSATVNTPQYAQSQTLLMIDVPSLEDIQNRRQINLWKANEDEGLINQLHNFGRVPDREELLQRGWEEVQVDVCPERLTTRNHISACRRQYSIVHMAASTVSAPYTWDRRNFTTSCAHLSSHVVMAFL